MTLENWHKTLLALLGHRRPEPVHTLEDLQKVSRYYNLRQELDLERVERVLRLVDGHDGDVVGIHNGACVYVCFTKENKVRYADYFAIDNIKYKGVN